MTAREPLDLDGILTDITGHVAELPVDVVDCVGCHIAVTDVPALVAEVRTLRVSEAEVVTALGEANDARLRLMAMCRRLTAEVERLRVGAEKVIGDYTRTAEEQRAGGDRDMAEMCEVVVMKIRRDVLGGTS